MKEDLLKLIDEKSSGSQPLLLVIRGSHAYGTNVETSDTDYAGVFIQSIDDILGFGYKEQINDDKNDIVIYEIKRFLQLLESNNPTVLELLNTPDNCIIYKHPIFNEVLNNRDKFITKICAKSFGGYGKMQIQKAKGQNKKQNWEKERVTRKDVLDFVYVIEGEKSIPWKVWCIEKPQYGKEYIKYETKFCGIVNVPHAKDLYAVYHDEAAQNCFSENISKEYRENNKKYYDEPYSFGYKGLVKTGEGDNVAESNALRLSSIPKGETPICNIVYNKDGYSEHCKDYKSYEDWLANKNEARWVDVKSHGQKIDGKNMMHSKRLMSMAREIAEGKGINVRRDDAEYLISIRKGEIDLQTLIDEVEKEIVEIDELFNNSTLPDSVDKKFVNELLIKIYITYN
jgi:predicted nucleotidyltransferase